MSLIPLIPLPLFHTPGPFQKGRADAFIIFPLIDIFESSHAATAVSPLQRGWGYAHKSEWKQILSSLIRLVPPSLT